MGESWTERERTRNDFNHNTHVMNTTNTWVYSIVTLCVCVYGGVSLPSTNLERDHYDAAHCGTSYGPDRMLPTVYLCIVSLQDDSACISVYQRVSYTSSIPARRA